MTNPSLARQGRSGRLYVWPPTGEPEIEVPSVTTIGNELAKPALVNWAAKEVATYAADYIDSWQGLDRDAAIDVLKRSPYRNSSRAAALGTSVHAAVEAWINEEGDDPPEVEMHLLPYVSAAIQFLDDHVDEVLYNEVTLFNERFQYAGTCDLIIRDKHGRIAVADWKTGKRLYPDVALQLVAYAKAEWAAIDGEKIALPAPIEVGYGVHLTDKAKYTAKEVEITDQLFRTFIALRTIRKYRDTIESTVLQKPKDQ